MKGKREEGEEKEEEEEEEQEEEDEMEEEEERVKGGKGKRWLQEDERLEEGLCTTLKGGKTAKISWR